VHDLVQELPNQMPEDIVFRMRVPLDDVVERLGQQLKNQLFAHTRCASLPNPLKDETLMGVVQKLLNYVTISAPLLSPPPTPSSQPQPGQQFTTSSRNPAVQLKGTSSKRKLVDVLPLTPLLRAQFERYTA
jgi:hypothetical protein